MRSRRTFTSLLRVLDFIQDDEKLLRFSAGMWHNQICFRKFVLESTRVLVPVKILWFQNSQTKKNVETNIDRYTHMHTQPNYVALKSRDMTLPTKVHLVKAMVFPVVMYGCESWTTKKAEHRRIDAFELWFWRRLLRVPWMARRSNK